MVGCQQVDFWVKMMCIFYRLIVLVIVAMRGATAVENEVEGEDDAANPKEKAQKNAQHDPFAAVCDESRGQRRKKNGQNDK